MIRRALALAESSRDDVSSQWDPRWHVGPITDRTDAEREHAVAWIRSHADELEWLAGRFVDDASRQLLVRLLAHRVAGSRRIAFALARSDVERLTDFAAAGLAVEPPDDLSAYPAYDLAPIGLDIRVVSVPMFVIHTFLLEQYRHPEIAAANVRSGDVVVDGGAFWGETALWLAEQAGPAGRVVAFEPDPANRPLLLANLAQNVEYAQRIEVRPEALWERPATLELTPQGGATTVAEGAAADVSAVALDELRSRGVVDRVDFLKLDVEGAEASALRGAAAAIGEDRPRLAVAVYHREDDIVAIPRLLDELLPTYRFALTHRSLHQLDTVLFAWPD